MAKTTRIDTPITDTAEYLHAVIDEFKTAGEEHEKVALRTRIKKARMLLDLCVEQLLLACSERALILKRIGDAARKQAPPVHNNAPKGRHAPHAARARR